MLRLVASGSVIAVFCDSTCCCTFRISGHLLYTYAVSREMFIIYKFASRNENRTAR
jgi:hypothetical protein